MLDVDGEGGSVGRVVSWPDLWKDVTQGGSCRSLAWLQFGPCLCRPALRRRGWRFAWVIVEGLDGRFVRAVVELLRSGPGLVWCGKVIWSGRYNCTAMIAAATVYLAYVGFHDAGMAVGVESWCRQIPTEVAGCEWDS